MNRAINTIFSNLSEVFRHILPGAVIAILALLSGHSPIASVAPEGLNTLWGFLVLSLIIGNLVYVIHRTLIHQFIDYIVWRCCPGDHDSYPRRIAHMIEHHFDQKNESARKSIQLKNSQIILTAITGELILLSSFVGGADSAIGAHRCAFFWIGAALFIGACFAHYISQRAIVELQRIN